MRPHELVASLALATFAVLGACRATVDPQPDVERTRALVAEITGLDASRAASDTLLDAAELAARLGDGLTLDEALVLALENNRRLQAGFLELGVARAEYVQAGLLRNPTLSLAFLFPDGGGRARVGGELAQGVAEFWQLADRRRAAELALDQRILELSRFAGELVLETRSAYHAALFARERFAVASEERELADSTRAAVARAVELGGATRAELGLAESDALAARARAQELERAELEAKHRLAALLSLEFDLSGVELSWAAPPEFADSSLGEDAWLSAVGERLDLRAARARLAALDAELALEHAQRIPDASVGLAAERPEAGGDVDLVAGLAGSIELPLFDDRSVRVRRAEYRRAALAKEGEALAAEALASARAARVRAAGAAEVARFYAVEVLPQAQRNADVARRAHELGDATVLTMLESRRRANEARRAAVDARWGLTVAVLEFERALGRPLDSVDRDRDRDRERERAADRRP